mgnify:CR=1 FL=1|jgi:hypothetical protein
MTEVFVTQELDQSRINDARWDSVGTGFHTIVRSVRPLMEAQAYTI